MYLLKDVKFIVKFWYFNSDILITENKINEMNE